MRLWSPDFSVRPSEMRASSFFSHSTWNTNQTRVYSKLFFLLLLCHRPRCWLSDFLTELRLKCFATLSASSVQRQDWACGCFLRRTFNSWLKNFHHCLRANLQYSTQPSLISATAFRAPQKHSHFQFACEHSSSVAFFLWFTASHKSFLYCLWRVNVVSGSRDVWMQSHFNNPSRIVWNTKNRSLLSFVTVDKGTLNSLSPFVYIFLLHPNPVLLCCILHVRADRGLTASQRDWCWRWGHPLWLPIQPPCNEWKKQRTTK